jgi:hypothetical protein
MNLTQVRHYIDSFSNFGPAERGKSNWLSRNA